MNLPRFVRQTLTVARRDFTATVLTPTFLVFLFAPLLLLAISGGIGGLSAAAIAGGGDAKTRLVALVSPADAPRIAAIDTRLRTVFRRGEEPPALAVRTPGADPARQARALFEARGFDVVAVLYGPLARPTILYGAGGARPADYLATLADGAVRGGPDGPVVTADKRPFARATASVGGRNKAGSAAVFGLFFLTLMLSGQVVGTISEERSNKVIEILAAAVPLEAVFLGKLIGMFGSALLFVLFWGTVAANIGAVLPAGIGGALRAAGPAVGLPVFALLFLAYFALAYLLLGAVFLGVGAQASTVRELQMLSLPITFTQIGMFGLAQAAAGRPGSGLARFAELFPLSSPFAMAARAANRPELWPHLLAIGWQMLWVGLVVAVGARAFRRGVLKSGSPRRRRSPG